MFGDHKTALHHTNEIHSFRKFLPFSLLLTMSSNKGKGIPCSSKDVPIGRIKNVLKEGSHDSACLTISLAQIEQLAKTLAGLEGRHTTMGGVPTKESALALPISS